MRQDKTLRAARGETLAVWRQWAAECEERGAEVVASEWSAKDGGQLWDESLAGTLAAVLFTPRGDTTLTNTVTLSNGETLKAWRLVRVG